MEVRDDYRMKMVTEGRVFMSPGGTFVNDAINQSKRESNGVSLHWNLIQAKSMRVADHMGATQSLGPISLSIQHNTDF